MKIIFFGTSPFAAQILAFLLERALSIVAIVTRPDRPSGRGLSLTSSAVKETALRLARHLPLYQPERASDPEFAKLLSGHAADLFLVAAFGEIIKQNLLNLPRLGCINVHASLLPKYRGAAPIQRALMDGAACTGVTIMQMVLQMDAGDILSQTLLPIGEETTFGELEGLLAKASCDALLHILPSIERGDASRRAQNHLEATFAPKIRPEEMQIRWDHSATAIHNLVRALCPSPGAWCLVEVAGKTRRLKIFRSRRVAEAKGRPGELLQYGQDGWVVACAEGALALLEVQLEGKNRMEAESFIKGQPLIRMDLFRG